MQNGFYGLQFYSAVMLAIKPLILLEWIHIFGTAGRRFTWLCYILGTINFLTYFIAITVDSSACKPRAAWWDLTVNGHCINTRNLPIATGTINAVIDLFILILPQRIIWKLHMSRDKKIGVGLVFAVGLLSCGAALARMSLSYIYSDSSDVAYNFSQAGLFCVVEMTCAIIVFSAPTIPKPIGHLAKQATSSINHLLRPFSSGSASYRTGAAVDSKSNVYVHIDEHGNAVPLAKLRSGKSGESAKSGQTGQSAQKHAGSTETGLDTV
ncbi:integral membrane PTH11 protein [Rutstroemia sp. NJR-2017a WRK4]|nr:integral membrane PTH11 protein [Rutstroemia sp. NJR-2017a WRK4]